VVEFAPLTLPWVLRTEAYAAAVGSRSDAEHHRALADIPYLVTVPTWEFVVHEWVLRTRWGPADQVAVQLEHLVTVAVQPSVCLRVLRATSAPVTGPFAVLRSRRWPDVAYREDGDRGILTDGLPDTRYFLAAQERVRAAALNAADSIDLIVELAVRLRQSPDDDLGGGGWVR
jgi:hypothetical protein